MMKWKALLEFSFIQLVSTSKLKYPNYTNFSIVLHNIVISKQYVKQNVESENRICGKWSTIP